MSGRALLRCFAGVHLCAWHGMPHAHCPPAVLPRTLPPAMPAAVLPASPTTPATLLTCPPLPPFHPRSVPIAPPLVGGYGGGVVVAPVVAGPSAVDFALFLMMATVMVGAFASLRSTGGFLGGAEGAGGARQLHMTKVQVGLVAMARDVKNRLDSIADAADTSNSKGLQMLLQGAHCLGGGHVLGAWRGAGARVRARCGRRACRRFGGVGRFCCFQVAAR